MPRSISPIGFRKPELTTDPRREGQVSVDQTRAIDPGSDIVDSVRDRLAQGVDVVGFYNQSGGRSFPSSGFMGAAAAQQHGSGSSLNAAFGDGLGGNNQPSGWQQHVARQTHNIQLQMPGQQVVLNPNGYPTNQNINAPMQINANILQQQPVQTSAQYMTEEERMISEYTAKSTAQPAVNPQPMSRNEYLNDDGQTTKKANIVRMDANGQLVAEDVASIEAEIVDQNMITAEQLDNIPVIQTAEQKPKPPKPAPAMKQAVDAPVLRTQGATKIAQEKKKLKVWKPKW